MSYNQSYSFFLKGNCGYSGKKELERMYKRDRGIWRSPGKEALTVGPAVMLVVKGRNRRILKMSKNQT